MTTNKPFKIYISWTGYYPLPLENFYECTHEPRPNNLSWTEINVYENKLVLVKAVDDKLSDIIVRTELKGKFTLRGNDYDLVQNAIANNFNELILKIERYNGNSYSEIWRGVFDIRGVADDNKKIVEISKFKTIDNYTDFPRWIDNEVQIELAEKDGEDAFITFPHPITGDETWRIYGMYELNMQHHLTNKMQYSNPLFGWVRIQYESLRFPNMYYLFGTGDAGYKNKLMAGVNGMVADFDGNTTADYTLSYKTIFEIYKKMFDIDWFIDQYNYGEPCKIGNQLFFRKKKDVYNNIINADYSLITEDFKGYKYILPKFVVHNKFEMSEKNWYDAHKTNSYFFNINDVDNEVISLSNVFTDAKRQTNAWFNEKRDEWLNSGDFFIGVGNRRRLTDSEWYFEKGTTQLGDTYNYKASLAYRLEHDLNNFRQLNEAFYNEDFRSLNPDFSMPLIEQEAFYIDDNNLDNIDFFGLVKTSLGNMRVKEASIELTSTKIKLVCVK